MYNQANIICKSLVIATFGLFITPAFSVGATETASSISVPPANVYTVRGTVVDDTNEPLPGATVFIKGTKTGTSTDIDGN